MKIDTIAFHFNKTLNHFQGIDESLVHIPTYNQAPGTLPFLTKILLDPAHIPKDLPHHCVRFATFFQLYDYIGACAWLSCQNVNTSNLSSFIAHYRILLPYATFFVNKCLYRTKSRLLELQISNL